MHGKVINEYKILFGISEWKKREVGRLRRRWEGNIRMEGLGIFLFTTASRTALGSTQSPIQWVPGAFSLRVKRPGRVADTHLHLVPRSRMRGTLLPLPNMPS
jgi:hypothetical protein